MKKTTGGLPQADSAICQIVCPLKKRKGATFMHTDELERMQTEKACLVPAVEWRRHEAGQLGCEVRANYLSQALGLCNAGSSREEHEI